MLFLSRLWLIPCHKNSTAIAIIVNDDQQVATINFRFQLNAQYFISIVMFLYMFRAHLCPSSGGPLYIYNIWFYVSLIW